MFQLLYVVLAFIAGFFVSKRMQTTPRLTTTSTTSTSLPTESEHL